MKSRRSGTLSGALAITLVVITASRAHADPRRQRVAECADAAEQSQAQRAGGHLLAARRLARTCSMDDCPRVVRRDCQTWATEVGTELGSLVVRARDPRGAALVPSRITIDGELSTEALEGRSFEIDPGDHVIVVHVDDRAPAEVRVSIAARQNVHRIVDVPRPEIAPAPVVTEVPRAPGPVTSRPAVPGAAWIAFGAAAVAGASFGYFGLDGNTRMGDLRSGCAPRCSDQDLEGAKRSYLVADVSLGIAFVALATGVWLTIQNLRQGAGSHAATRSGPSAPGLLRGDL